MQPQWEVVAGPAPEPPKEAPIGWEGDLQYSVRHASMTSIPDRSSTVSSLVTGRLKRVAMMASATDGPSAVDTVVWHLVCHA